MGDFEKFQRISELIPGWIEGADAEELMRVSFELDSEAVIVEIGSFFGRSTVLLAGPRCIRRSGIVHCVDPFDCSGDLFSVPHYKRILQAVGGGSLRDHFEANLRRSGLSDFIEVHQGRAEEIASTWNAPIDLLLLDGDQSPEGARLAYKSWAPFLKPGGIIVLRNTKPRAYEEGHDGHWRLVMQEIIPPKYTDIRLVRATTFARKTRSSEE